MYGYTYTGRACSTILDPCLWTTSFQGRAAPNRSPSQFQISRLSKGPKASFRFVLTSNLHFSQFSRTPQSIQDVRHPSQATCCRCQRCSSKIFQNVRDSTSLQPHSPFNEKTCRFIPRYRPRIQAQGRK